MANGVEIKFLNGPQSRWKELKFTFQTMAELIHGFRALHFIGPCITVFGSARFKEDHPYYQQTRKTAAAFAQLGFTILTGGGPGLMEAANRGAKDVGGRVWSVMPEIYSSLNGSLEVLKICNIRTVTLHLPKCRIHPGLHQRISQYHAASYAGVKPKSLSRIRKRIFSDK